MLFPFLLDFLAESSEGFSKFVTEINSSLLEKIFTPDTLLVISWISYGLIAWYIFKAFKNLRIEGLKFVILVIYNLFIQLDLPAVQGTYYFWIIGIIAIYIIELFAYRYAPENRDVIDTSDSEE